MNFEIKFIAKAIGKNRQFSKNNGQTPGFMVLNLFNLMKKEF